MLQSRKAADLCSFSPSAVCVNARTYLNCLLLKNSRTGWCALIVFPGTLGAGELLVFFNAIFGFFVYCVLSPPSLCYPDGLNTLCCY